MVEKRKASLLALLALLLCAVVALALAPWGTRAKAADGDATDDAVLVLDKIEDFRTEDNGDGTYSIMGSKKNPPQQVDATTTSFAFEENGLGASVYVAKETGFSEIGMRKVLGVPYTEDEDGYNLGLIKGEGDNVPADETDEAFQTRVSAEVFERFMYGGARDKKVKIVIPAEISYIDGYAFVLVSAHKIMEVGLNSYENLLATMQEQQPDVEDLEQLGMALKWAILSGDMNESTGEVTHYIDPAMLIEIEFAKNAQNARALQKTQGQKVFGSCGVDAFTVPKELTDASMFIGIENSQLIFEEDAETIPGYVTSSSKITSITIPAQIKNVGQNAFRNCYNLTDIYILGENVQFGSMAFSIDRPQGVSANVYVNSLEQWLSFEFLSDDANPLYSRTGGGLGKLFVKNDSGTYDRLINVRIPDKNDRTLGQYAFYNSEIESITIGSVDKIESGVFGNCENLKYIKMTRVNSLATAAFEESGIESVELPSGLSALPLRIFAYCRSLKTVTFPEDCAIHTIGERAFTNCSALESIVIPNSVEKILASAFNSCEKLNSITFAAGSKLTEIGNDAFLGCSHITQLDLPKTVEKIGSTAFLQYDTIDATGQACALTVSINGELSSVGTDLTSAGNNPRSNNAYFKCVDYNAYKALTDAYAIESGRKTYAIYPIEVDYVYVSGAGQTETVDTQRYWYGVPAVEGKQLPYGVAATNVVLSDKSDMWYGDSGCTAHITRDDVQNAVEGQASSIQAENGKITLYMNSITGYIAKNDIVYDRSKTYMPDDPVSFNALLVSDSTQLTAQNVLTIQSYTDAFGNTAAVPSSVHAAGTYVIAVDGGKTFTLTIARKNIDVSAFDFMVARVGGQGVSQPLESATLHLYADKDGTTYPSLSPLDDENLAYYSTVAVSRAFTRFRGEGVAITLEMDCDEYTDLLEIIYGGEYSVSDYGAYTATAQIRASGNYAYTITQNEEALAERGIRFERNGDVVTVTKVWYVLAMSNWLVTSPDATENNYTLYTFEGSHSFGANSGFTIPYVMFGDIAADKFGTTEDKLSFALAYGNVNIGIFNRANYGQYINAAMPVGNYELTVTFGLVGGTDYFIRTFRYAVTEAELPTTELKALNDILKGKTFAFDYDNSMHLLTTEVRQAIQTLQAAITAAQPDRNGTVWADTEYDAYYGDFKIAFNLDRMRSNVYFTENDLNGEEAKPVAPDKYIVYYLLHCNNYASIVNDTDDYDTARRQFVFYVKIVREIEIPTANGATYTGAGLKADIPSSAFYTVNEYEGFTAAGTHSVTLTLVNAEYYRWKGKELGTATATVEFTIQKALNEFIEAPDVVRWIEGKFNEEENGFIGAAKFGSITYVITDTDDNVLFDLTQGIDARADMKAGTYILKATVAGNDNYNGLSEAFTIRILEKAGMPWWGTLLIVIGVLGVVAIVIFVLWKKGVFQILTGKIVLAIRTRATVDATIAAVRANKVAEAAKVSLAQARARDAAEARKAQAERERALPAEEKAAALEQKAQQANERAEKMRARAEVMQARAARLRGEAVSQEAAATQDGRDEE